MPLTVLMYHRVAKGQDDDPFNVPVERFRRQMSALAKGGLQVVGLAKAASALSGLTRPEGRAVCLTFDDGAADFFENAYPVLAEHGFPATVFLVSSFAGKSVDFDGRATRFLSWDQAAEMTRNRIDIQSHTVSHPELPSLGDGELARQLADSRREIEERLGRPVDQIAYPFGRYDGRVMEATRKAGYRFGWAAGLASGGPFDLERMKVMGGDGVAAFRLKASGWAGRIRAAKHAVLGRLGGGAGRRA